MDSNDTRIVESAGGRPMGHGIYPAILPGIVARGVNLLPAHEYFIIWARVQPGLYPTLSAYRADPNMMLNGGVAADPDTVIATYAVYKKHPAGSFRLQFWCDFDHWPLDAQGASLVAGLADGHYHPGANTAQQLPLTPGHQELMLRLTAYVRFGTF